MSYINGLEYQGASYLTPDQLCVYYSINQMLQPDNSDFISIDDLNTYLGQLMDVHQLTSTLGTNQSASFQLSRRVSQSKAAFFLMLESGRNIHGTITQQNIHDSFMSIIDSVSNDGQDSIWKYKAKTWAMPHADRLASNFLSGVKTNVTGTIQPMSQVDERSFNTDIWKLYNYIVVQMQQFHDAIKDISFNTTDFLQDTTHPSDGYILMYSDVLIYKISFTIAFVLLTIYEMLSYAMAYRQRGWIYVIDSDQMNVTQDKLEESQTKSDLEMIERKTSLQNQNEPFIIRTRQGSIDLGPSYSRF